MSAISEEEEEEEEADWCVWAEEEVSLIYNREVYNTWQDGYQLAHMFVFYWHWCFKEDLWHMCTHPLSQLFQYISPEVGLNQLISQCVTCIL